MREKLRVEYGVHDTLSDTSRTVETPGAQEAAPVFRDEEAIARQWKELEHRRGRSCSNCRYYSPPSDPEVQAVMVNSHALSVIEQEAQIKSRYALPLMQGICHLGTKLSSKGGSLTFTLPQNFCDNHGPKNRLVGFFGQLRNR